MHPTTNVLPAPTVFPAARRQPTAVLALRVVAGVQAVLLLVGAALGLALAAVSSTGLGGDDEAAAWAGLGVFLGLLFAAVCAVGATALGLPVVLLRAGRPRPHRAALIALVVLEALIALAALIGAVNSVLHAGPASALLPLLLAMAAATAVVLGLQPDSRAWARQG